MTFNFLLPFLYFLLLNACTSHQERPAKVNTTIAFQPFSDMDMAQFRDVVDSIRKLYPRVVVNQPVKLPDFAFYAIRGRFKADSLLKYLNSLAQNNQTIIGFTVMDISTRKGAIPDWGVMGLGTCPGNSCVVSTFRLNMAKGKNQLFKVAVHELGHTMGLHHCPNAECFMRDAEGENHTNEEKGFCSNCSKYLRQYNWNL